MFYVACPKLGEGEYITSEDQAFDVCYAMHEESGSYAYIRDAFGNIHGEYGDVMEGIADMLFWLCLLSFSVR